jgi:hypothetical protein
MFTIFFILSIGLLLSGAYFLLFKFNNTEQDYVKNENADDYLFAEKVFTRDPETFKDKNKNRIDDPLEE